MSKYIALPLEEYEEMLARIEQLTRRKDAPMPAVEDIVFLSPRLYGHLTRHGIKNIADLENTSKNDWLRLPGFGQKSWQEMKDIMKFFGLKFKEE